MLHGFDVNRDYNNELIVKFDELFYHITIK